MRPDDFYFAKAAEQAKMSTCYRAKCGAVIVAKNGEIIGADFNAPPLNDENQRTCDAKWELSRKPKYDKTCCIHAEWNAIIDALKNFGSRIDGGILYFMRVDDNGNWTDAGNPFCTVCSRLAMQSGLKSSVLWADGMAKNYTVEDYNRESYEFYKREEKIMALLDIYYDENHEKTEREKIFRAIRFISAALLNQPERDFATKPSNIEIAPIASFELKKANNLDYIVAITAVEGRENPEKISADLIKNLNQIFPNLNFSTFWRYISENEMANTPRPDFGDDFVTIQEVARKLKKSAKNILKKEEK